MSDLEAFRAEARAWLGANFPKSLANDDVAMNAQMAGQKLTGDAEKWRKAMGEKGWGTPTWPKEYGGGGLSGAEARVLQQEMARIGARNPIVGMGTSMFGPTLLEYGNEEQKRKHLPPICRGELRWCQGYSEPGAGSDLASLQTRCEDKGDHFLVNGQKIWTSGAQYADWCFCLVRTDTRVKHEGISFLLIDMKSPGVEARPIKLIAGSSPFCETFFTNVKVPKENLVGPLNGGWTVAKRLLQFERSGQGGQQGAANRTGDQRAIEAIAKSYVGVDALGRIDDSDLRARIALHKMEQRAMALTVQRHAAAARDGRNNPGFATSYMKNANAKINQDRAELAIEIMGNRAFGWEGDGFTESERQWTRNWLSGKAMTIYGGSTEIQNNVIAKRILGLLDHQ
jgi:alkylation response protein AidB-like acyl-CoA dehydrogenase